jgi:hypothetical protein
MHGLPAICCGVLESLVDLTYHGIALGRRVKLMQVRPSTGFLELASPMPVGSELVITADDGLTFGATVTWIHEQVGGAAGTGSAGAAVLAGASDRPVGMQITPSLTSAAAAAWWQARVALADDEPARPGPSRNRPVTVRPRSHTRPDPTAGAITGNTSAIIADLNARIASAAPAPAIHDDPNLRRTIVMSTAEQERLELQARALDDLEPSRTERFPAARQEPADGDAALADVADAAQASDHVVVDDGSQTVIMEAVDPSDFDADTATTGAPSSAVIDERSPVAEASHGIGEPADRPAPESPEAPPVGKSSRKKRRTR